MARNGQPLYKAHRVHVVRYFKGSEPRRLTTQLSFRAAKRWIQERHGKAAADTAVSWG